MEDWQQINILICQKAIVEAQIEAMGMAAENVQRANLGQSVAYDEKAFQGIIDRLNAVWEANRP